MGDGARRYDLENDGEGSSLGGCSVSVFFFFRECLGRC